jgi:hypothetical protein
MAALTSDGITRLRQAPEPDAPLTLQVLTMHRCMIDKGRKDAISPGSHDNEDQFPQCADGYDLVLSDGTRKFKAGLSTRLNELVYQGQLVPLGLVRVYGWSFFQQNGNFNTFNPPEMVLIHDLRIVPAPPGADGADLPLPPVQAPAADAPPAPLVLAAPVIADPNLGLTFVFPPTTADAEAALQRLLTAHTGPLPLFGKRGHYVKLDSDQPEITSRWLPPDDDPDANPDAPEDDPDSATALIDAEVREGQQAVPQPGQMRKRPPGERPFPTISQVTLQEDSRAADDRRLPGRRPTRRLLESPLVGRVIVKTALNHFGSPTEPQPFPCKYELRLADSSGVRINVVVWNALCETTFTRVHVGDAVMVRGYRLKHGTTEYEVSLNTRNPAGKLEVLSANDEYHLAAIAPSKLVPNPSPTYDSIPELRARLRRYGQDAADRAPSWEDTAKCDVHGVVAAVLPAYRHRLLPRGMRDFVHFNRARWVLLLLSDLEGAREGQVAGPKAIGQVPLLLDEAHCGVPMPTPAAERGAQDGDDVRFGFFDKVLVLDFVTLCNVRVCHSGADGGFFLASTQQTHATRQALEDIDSTPLNEILIDSIEMDDDQLAAAGAQPHDSWLAPPPPPAGGGGAALARLFLTLPTYQDMDGSVEGDRRADVIAGKCDALLQRESLSVPVVLDLAGALHAGEVKQVLVNGLLSDFEVRPRPATQLHPAGTKPAQHRRSVSPLLPTPHPM